jgi:hypothetical protein
MPTQILISPPVRWPRFQAWAVFALVTFLVVWSLWALYWPRAGAPAEPPQGGKDLEAYRRIVERVHAGESYYGAAGSELHARGYASSSVFNWRLPIYAWLLAALPTPEWGQVLLGLLALLALGLAYAADRADGGSLGRSLILVTAMAGAFLWCVDGDAFFAQELWAGVLIALSVGCYGVRFRVGGIAAGLAALAIRELALPFVLVAPVLAIRERRWRETMAWCIGLACYAIFLGWHAWQVQQHLTGQELAEAEGWIQFGGPAFVVHTSQMNVWLFNLPAWIALLYLAASLLGMSAFRGPNATLIWATVGIYLVAFLVIGKPFNIYWGLLYVALLPTGLVRTAAVVRTWLRASGMAAVPGRTSVQAVLD